MKMVDNGHPLTWVVIEIILAFIFGIVMRYKVARFLIKTWKMASNSLTNIELISIRTYNSIEKVILDKHVFHDIKQRIPNIKYDSVSETSMQIGLSPFGTIIVLLESVPSLEDEDISEEIKISLFIKNPIRLGFRDMDLINDYVRATDLIFQVIESKFSKGLDMNNNYIIAEIPRVGGFLEEKTYEIDDEVLSIHLHATVSKITISAKPPLHITKAVKKYLFA